MLCMSCWCVQRCIMQGSLCRPRRAAGLKFSAHQKCNMARGLGAVRELLVCAGASCRGACVGQGGRLASNSARIRSATGQEAWVLYVSCWCVQVHLAGQPVWAKEGGWPRIQRASEVQEGKRLRCCT